MRNFLKMFALFILAAALLTVIVTGCEQEPEVDAEDPTIKVGVVGPMGYVQGDHNWYGAEIAKEEINAAGGIEVGDQKYEIELVRVDTNELHSVDDAISAVERAIEADNVDLMVGGFRTEAVFPMTEIAAENEKIFIICGAASAALTKGRVDEDYDKFKYVFHLTPINTMDIAQLAFVKLMEIADALREELGIAQPRVAVLMDRLEWTDALVAGAEETIPQAGMEHAGTWRPSATATDISSELAAIQDSGAHIIFTALSGPAAVTYGRQWGELEIPACSFGLSAESQKLEFWEATDGYCNYETSLNTYGKAAITDKTLPFMESFLETTGDTPSHSAGTYDALYVYKDAVERAGTVEVEAVVEAMADTDYEGALGRVEFSDFHSVTWGPEHVTGVANQWQDGELVCVWPYEWSPVEGVEITFDGVKPYKIPPRVIEYWSE